MKIMQDRSQTINRNWIALTKRKKPGERRREKKKGGLRNKCAAERL